MGPRTFSCDIFWATIASPWIQFRAFPNRSHTRPTITVTYLYSRARGTDTRTSKRRAHAHARPRGITYEPRSCGERHNGTSKHLDPSSHGRGVPPCGGRALEDKIGVDAHAYYTAMFGARLLPCRLLNCEKAFCEAATETCPNGGATLAAAAVPGLICGDIS